ncbi:MAG: hypothetical protein HWD60_14260 [Defluviicoccus sp.]|nr:MAG: hypothetical protein HWD60_14260 [Defluviicoccus sp.]
MDSDDGKAVVLAEAAGDADRTRNGGSGEQISARGQTLVATTGTVLVVGDVLTSKGGNVDLSATAGMGATSMVPPRQKRRAAAATSTTCSPSMMI